MLRSDHGHDRGKVKPSPLHRWDNAPAQTERPRPARPKARRKSFKRRFLEEAFDLIEDIFD
jgi:hypothetical protein